MYTALQGLLKALHFGETGMEMVDDGFIDNSLDQAEGTSVSKELYVISPVLPSA